MTKTLRRDKLKEDNSYHISQFKTNMEGIITAELVDGQSIDNAVDSLISTHASDDNAHHDPEKYVSPFFEFGEAGFVQDIGGGGATFKVAFSDSDARLQCNFICPYTSSDWKFTFVSFSNTASRTANGVIRAGQGCDGESVSVTNIFNAANHDLAHTAANTWYYTSTSTFSLTVGDFVSCRWDKDANDGTGNLNIVAIFLTR